MNYFKLSLLMFTLNLMSPLANAAEKATISFLGKTRTEQHLANGVKRSSLFIASNALFDSINSKAIKSWPQNIYGYKYKEEKLKIEFFNNFYLRSDNTYDFGWGAGTWKTIPLHDDFVLLLSTNRNYLDMNAEVTLINIYRYRNNTFTEMHLETEVVYKLLKSSSVKWELAHVTSKSKKYNHWVIDGQLNEFVKVLNQYLDDDSILYGTPILTSLSQLESEDYENFISDHRVVGKELIELNELNTGKGMTSAEVNSLIFGKILPLVSNFSNKYARYVKYSDMKWFNTSIFDMYESIQEGGESMLLQLRNTAFYNSINTQMKNQEKYTLLNDYSSITNAVTSKNMTEVHNALKNSKDINAHYQNWSAVNQAAQNGFLPALKLLVENGADIEVRTKNKTPLLSAVSQGNFEAAQYLIEQGADVNARMAANLNTALIRAAKNNKPKMVRLLLENGANLWDTNYVGDSAWAWASHNNHKNIIKILEEFNAKEGFEAYEAIKTGNVNDFERAINKMTNIYQLNPEDDGMSLLSTAADKGEVQMMQLLIDKGFNINFSSYNGATAAYLAAKNNHFDAFVMLGEQGADLAFHKWYAPIHTASYRGHIDILKYLLKQKYSKPSLIASQDGGTALHQAIEGNQTAVVKLLLQEPAYNNTHLFENNALGDSPLITLFKYKHDNQQIFNMLINKSGTNKNLRNKEGKNAYDYAKEAGLKHYLSSL